MQAKRQEAIRTGMFVDLTAPDLPNSTQLEASAQEIDEMLRQEEDGTLPTNGVAAGSHPVTALVSLGFCDDGAGFTVFTVSGARGPPQLTVRRDCSKVFC